MEQERTSGEQAAHLAAIQQIVDRWMSGELSLASKREAIARENRFYHGRDKRSAITGEVLTQATAEVGSTGHTTRASHSSPASSHASGASHADDDRELQWWQK